MTNLTQFLEPRARLLAHHLSHRFHRSNQNPHAWSNYDGGELYGWQETADTVIYSPHVDHRDARIYFRNIRLKDIGDISWGEPEG